MKVDLRLALPAVAAWIAAGTAIALPGTAAPWSWGLFAASGICLTASAAARSRRRKRAGHGLRSARLLVSGSGVVACCLAGAALSCSAVAFHSPLRQPPSLVAAAHAGRVVQARIVVDSAITSTHGSGFASSRSLRFRGTIRSVEVGTRRTAANAPCLVFATSISGPLQIGDTVAVRATMRALPSSESTALQVYATDPPRRVSRAGGWLAWATDLRQGFSETARQLPGDGGDLLPGLAIGDVSAVGPDLDAAMKQSSLSHLTAVSGSNCAIVISLAMALAAACGLGRAARVGVALAVLGGFVILVTPGPSVLRAAVMAVIMVVSAASGRPSRGIPALAGAVIALLATDPWLSRDYGFALSVLATGGILVLASPLSAALARWMPSSLATVIAIPLAAQLACQPVLILLNPTVPVFGVAANLLAEPAAPIATVLGLIACLVIPLFPQIGAVVAWVAWLPSAWIAQVASALSALPQSQLPWLTGLAGVIALSSITVALLIVLLWWGRRGSRILAGATALLLIFGGTYGGLLIGSGISSRITIPGDWQIAACDIGQGDAVLVRDGRFHALIDVGPDPVPLRACLNRLGISRIDLLVLTHFDLDHVGGLQAVVGHVGTALVGTPEDGKDQARIDALVRGGADVRHGSSGMHGTLGATTWSVLWPKTGSTSMQVGNPGSSALMFTGHGIRSLFLADLGEDAQNALLATHTLSRVDVVKVAHHGSADQSPDLYRAIHARLGVISVGAGNSYGHPTQRALGILARAGTAAVRTDQQGMIIVCASSGERLSVWSERRAQASTRAPTGR